MTNALILLGMLCLTGIVVGAVVASIVSLVTYTPEYQRPKRHVTKLPNRPVSAKTEDYCAGCDKVRLRMSMRWTDDGLWRCRECYPMGPVELHNMRKGWRA